MTGTGSSRSGSSCSSSSFAVVGGVKSDRSTAASARRTRASNGARISRSADARAARSRSRGLSGANSSERGGGEGEFVGSQPPSPRKCFSSSSASRAPVGAASVESSSKTLARDTIGASTRSRSAIRRPVPAVASSRSSALKRNDFTSSWFERIDGGGRVSGSKSASTTAASYAVARSSTSSSIMKFSVAAMSRGSGCASGGTHVSSASRKETPDEGNSFPAVSSSRSVRAFESLPSMPGWTAATLMGATRAPATPFARKSGTARKRNLGGGMAM